MAPVTSTLGLVIALSLGVFGFSPDTSGRAVAKPPAGPGVAAARVQGSVEIDGRLSEPAWAAAEPFTEFQQRSPHEGAPATLRTEVRVLYDDDAIYVGARLLDTAPDSILARLARRDDSISSDLFTLYLDPFHDRRSGYYFKINAAGTLYDGTLSNDVDKDKSWDGVWSGAARVDEQGWTAEMRIPYSQLRFQRNDRQVWGINFGREIPRRREDDYAAYPRRKESSFVSRFPDLVGIESIAPPRSIELMPYVTSKGEDLRHDPGDPFHSGWRLRPNAGGDLRMGVGSHMTLNATANPDFGQVEVDPSVVNLTDVETSLDEKRPFFVEGVSAFEFGRQGAGDYWDYDWDDPVFFYSRRIGREPEGKIPSSDFEDVPPATRILGAAKLIGRTAGGWNVGTLHAVTDRETARLSKDGRTWRSEIEPRAYYGVTRLQRALGGGRAGIGLLGTATARSFDEPALRSQFDHAALMGGVDGWLTLDRDGTWVLSGWSAMSRVEGDRARMIKLQQGSTHYFQRRDASHVEVDSSLTQLTGYGSRYWINKQKGATLFNAAIGFLTPEFEVNDLGYQTRSDLVNGHIGTGYKWTRPTRSRRYQSLKVATFGTFDYGGNLTKQGQQVLGYTEFNNGYAWDYYASYNPQTLNNRRTRGGPLTLNPRQWYLGSDFNTDSQKRLYYYLSASGGRSESGAWSLDVSPGMEWRPTGALTIKVGPSYEHVEDDAQYVDTQKDTTAIETYGQRYLFATVQQNTVSASLRLNWAFTPTLSLQTYVQPFVSTADYFDFKALIRPRSYAFAPAPYSGDNPDFTVRSLKGSAVMRWEYRPGSALFLIWTQKRSDSEPIGVFDLGQVRERLGLARPENVLMAKLSYYFTP